MPSRRTPADDPLDPAVYYGAVAERIVPFLPDRALTFTRGPQRALVHAESGTDIRIQNADDLMMHVSGGAVSFFADPIGSNGEVWFALALNGSGVPFEAVRLSALKLYLVLRDVELDAFIYYDGMGGFRFLWTWGVLDPDELPEGIGDLHAGLGRELHRLMERRFVDTPERARIGRWLGYDGPVTALRVEDRAGGASDRSKPADSDLVHFIVNDPRGGPIVPVPWSLNPPGDRAARPVDRSDLFRFDPDRHGTPQASVRLRRRFALPLNFPRAALRVLEGAS